MLSLRPLAFALSIRFHHVAALLQVQTDTWNSSFKLTTAQIASANLSDDTVHNVEIALNFERSNNAGGLIQNDPFYQVPSHYDLDHLPPFGTILKVEQNTNLTLYTIPNSVSMSRFLYVTETYNGTRVPASAYVLWPYWPRSFPGVHACSGHSSGDDPVFPIVGLAHGTTGQTIACAPSGLRGLWDDWHEPFPIALSGYAVVAPDYAGYGVPNVKCPYFVLPAQSNDLYHAIAAAQSQWPTRLSKQFVIAGQSHGGGVAWASAQRQHQRPVAGYLGTVAASPFTDVLEDILGESSAQDNARVAGIAQGLNDVLPDFDISDWLTPVGVARWNLIHEISGCGTTGGQLSAAENGQLQILKTGWNETWAAQWYRNATMNGGKPFAGPMLVIQGTQDPNAYEPATSAAVNKTCALYPASQLEYIRFQNITHVPVLYAAQHVWLDWIRDRFAGVKVKKGCSQATKSPPAGVNGAQFAGFNGQTWFVEYDEYGI
jgi:pimeloyl-ACP methyl ester carboxylesterase